MVRNTTSTIIIPATCKLANGSVTLLPPTNTYTWNDGFVGNVRNNLVAGNYLIAIDAIDTDCRNFIEVVVNATAGDLDASYVVNQLPSTCDATNGIVTINVVMDESLSNTHGMMALFSMVEQRIQDLNLAVGNYSVTIEDANGCITIENITLIDSTNNGDIAITILGIEDVTCYGTATG